MKKFNTLNVVTTAMLTALAVILARTFHHLAGGALGSLFSPMHFPILVAGLLCGPYLGLIGGLFAPILSFAMSGMPAFPNGLVPMAFELAAYGLIIALVYARLPRRGVGAVYGALLAAMVGGRLVWGLAEILLLGLAGNAFTVQAFLSGALLSAVPGILLQLVLIPGVMAALDRTGVVPFGAAQG